MTVASKLLDHPGLVALCNKGHLPGVNEAVEAVFVNVSNQSAPALSIRLFETPSISILAALE